MKANWISLAVGLVVISTSSLAFADDQSSGCGLGWQVTKKNSLASSSIRATTNGLFSNNLFGMTFGTSGCSKHSIVQNEKKSLYFAEANYQNLMVEMAEGKGEYLGAFAMVLGCNSDSLELFSNITQAKYSEIFDAAQAPVGAPSQMLQNVKREIRQNPALAAGCQSEVI